MAKEKEVESIEEEIRELRRSLLGVLEAFLPPKEVREEVVKNVYTIELSLLRILKTLIDYKVESLQSRIEKKQGKKKAKRIEVE
ncbi:MAG: hypothetical protein Q9N26_00575 [Aquificota bacterium]|nr:hypothetical protein [Aquificota bacterium]MDQ7082307.1 hypothetical protein [Aquificota bacterium]